MVGRARGRDVSVNMVTALSTLGMFSMLSALGGIDSTLLEPDPAVTLKPSEVRYVQADWLETVVRGRPWVPYKRMATIARGTRLVVRGEVDSRDKEGCEGKTWYAVWPFGYVCSRHVTKTDEPPVPGAAMPLAPGKRVPHAYATVRGEGVPEYASVEQAELGVAEATLEKGMMLVVKRSVMVAGVEYLETRSGRIVPKANVAYMGQGSDWHGVRIVDAEAGPLFGWVNPEKVVVRKEPRGDADAVRTLLRRERVPVFESDGDWRRIGDDEWLRDEDLNEVIIVEPPEGAVTEFRIDTTGNRQWVDVDVGEQVLVAYRGQQPEFATLIASGRSSPTPLGNYPVWAKVASMDMNNQGYEDNAYRVEGVPWVLLFQAHNALHGAYWHNRFGNRKSHGCVNLAPLDARFMFDWVGPMLPYGWTGYLPSDLNRAPVVHVRDSSRPEGMQFTQERPTGPPDFAAEREKTEAAEARRLAAAEREAAEAEATGGPAAGEPTDASPGSGEPTEAPPTLLPPRTFGP
jgi:hypothetical protein